MKVEKSNLTIENGGKRNKKLHRKRKRKRILNEMVNNRECATQSERMREREIKRLNEKKANERTMCARKCSTSQRDKMFIQKRESVRKTAQSLKRTPK